MKLTHFGQARRMATPNATPRVDPLLAMRGDPKLAPFLLDDFDGTAFASAVLASGSDATKDAKKSLDLTIASLDAALGLTVREHHDVLLHQLGGIDEADRVLQIVTGGVSSLRQTMGRVKDELGEPHDAVSGKTLTLENLTKTVDVLRRAVRHSKLNTKLKASLMIGESVDDHAATGGLGGADEGTTTDDRDRARRVSNAAAGDLARAAKTLCDLELLKSEGGDELVGIEWVEKDAKWVTEAHRETRRRAGVALDNGIQSASQAEVGAALQVFHNLNELRSAVTARVVSLAQNAIDSVRDALDPKALSREAGSSSPETETETSRSSAKYQSKGLGSRPGFPPAGEETRWAEILWQRVERAFDVARVEGLKTWHLQRVLAKKRDPITHVLFLDEVLFGGGNDKTTGDEDDSDVHGAFGDTRGDADDDDANGDEIQKYVDGSRTSAGVKNTPCAVFISLFSKGAFEVLARSNASAGFAKDALLSGYPRLVYVLETLHLKLLRDSDAKGAQSAVRKNGVDAFLINKIADPVAQAYHARVFSCLAEPVDSLLSPNTLQQIANSVVSGGVSGSAGAGRGGEDVRRFLSRVRQELDAVALRPGLVAEVMRTGVAKALVLMSKRAETATNTSHEARYFAVGTPVSSAQRANAALASSLEEVIKNLGKIVPHLASAPSEALQGALATLRETARDIVNTTLASALAKINAHFAAMHDEDWSGGPPPGQDASPYAARAVEALGWLDESGFFALFPPLDSGDATSALSPSGDARADLATEVFSSFTRNACLLRLGENGKLRLAKDTAELERAVDQFVFPTKYLASASGAHASIRALRAAVFLSLDELVEGAEAWGRLGDEGTTKENDAEKRKDATGAASLVRDLPKQVTLMLAFSMAPNSVQTPWQRAGLTPSLYATWMNTHAGTDIAAAATETLDAFDSKRSDVGAEAKRAASLIRAAKKTLFPSR